MAAGRDEAVSAREGAWHQSHLTQLLTGCSWQWMLTNLFHVAQTPKPASEAGTAMHNAIEAHELARKLWYDSDGTEGKEAGITQEEGVGIIDAYLDTVVPNIQAHHYPVMNKGTKREKVMEAQDVYDAAYNAWDAWYNATTIDGGLSNREYVSMFRPKVLEPYFKAELVEGAMPIAGWADAIYEYGDGRLLVVDWKSAKELSRWKNDDHRTQATMYTVALVVSGEYGVDDLRDVDFLYGINRTQVSASKNESVRNKYERAMRVQVVPDLEDVKQLGVMIREAQRIYDTNDYVKNPGWGALCSQTYCPVFNECMVTGEYDKPFIEIAAMFAPTV